ncbi:MBL fold metallo-hydrolase [Sphingorhabdus sp.]|jgi:glyoxylase-like metal-dependent hydrolase (beta-lactamase superfamily II)|uniref:MBL fold metallo-hydrolase n=1 Tax=Sphingorhabdus sp. TaxID=1902408 RepID=UPI002CDDB3FC|nr:MBL fold metallo-hydrolase [Sphingorhabdus sp.]HMT41925.1 MBL fold metallo-hydrolase [Sphingorhabdus sp.]
MADAIIDQAAAIIERGKSAPVVVKTFFDEDTFTATHVVSDPATSKAAIIDSVLDFDAPSGRTSTKSADLVVEYVKNANLDIEWILETHAHADHISAAPYLQERLGGTLAIGAEITHVQGVFGKVFNLDDRFKRDGSQFERLFGDGATFKLGSVDALALHVPGHTPADMAFVIGDAAFIGDTLFMPDYGTARADFPGGDARTLFRSIKRLLTLPGETRLFLCHDYKAPGRDVFAWETTVAAQRSGNVHVHDGVSEDEFVAMREARDATLGMPKLILPSIQVNIRGGHFPEPEANGSRYLKLPVDAL